jgi:hypothetical protein
LPADHCHAPLPNGRFFRRTGKETARGNLADGALDDGTGLHVFLLAVSRQPLPVYAEEVKRHGRAPWKKDADALGVDPLQRLTRWWQDKEGIKVVAVLGVAVWPR